MTPRVRAVTLTSYVEVARFVGLDPYAMLLEKRINPQHLEDPERRLSAGSVISLLEDSASLSGCLEFGILMAKCRSFASLGPLSLMLQHMPSPKGVIAGAIEFRHLLNDIIALNVEESGNISRIRCDVVHEDAGFQVISLMVSLAFRVLVDSSGGLWQPECVHFIQSRPDNLRPFQEYFRTDLSFDSDFDGFSCSTHALEIPNPRADELMARHARSLLKLMRVNTQNDTPLDHTRYAISLLIGSGQPTLSSVAANLGLSVRSLQRLLEREGRSFSDLLNEVRRQLAVRFLNSSSLPLNNIAEMVGYGSNSSFSRWFANEFGETPRAWRSRQDRARKSWVRRAA